MLGLPDNVMVRQQARPREGHTGGTPVSHYLLLDEYFGELMSPSMLLVERGIVVLDARTVAAGKTILFRGTTRR